MLPEQEKIIKQLYETYFCKLTSFAMASVHDPHIAEEIAQDTFHTALLHIDEIANHPNPGGWLMQTTKYKIKEYQRRRSQDLRHLVSLETIRPFEADGNASAFDQAEATPSENILEQIRAILSPEEYALFQQLILKRASHLSVAKEFGISVSASQKRLQRIREKLRKYLK